MSARRIARGSAVLRSSLTKTRLPNDFDILVPLIRDETGVHPVAHERRAVGRLALRDLAFVMGVDQVGAATVQIEGRARGATSTSPSTRCAIQGGRVRTGNPSWFVGERRLPKDEVERIALAGVVGMPAPLAGELDHLLARSMRELAVCGDLRDVEVRDAVGVVGEAAIGEHAGSSR